MALDQTKKWTESGLSVPVSVNLSVRMLEDNDLPKYLAHALQVRNLPASCLTFELTETMAMSNIEQTEKMFNQLSALGVKTSIDDFGVGFTSLHYLQQLHVSEIKIDKTFVVDLQRNFRSKAIIQAIVILAEGLGTSVVVEGIEDIGLIEQLHKLGCHFGQGYSIARPMRSEKFNDWRLNWSN